MAKRSSSRSAIIGRAAASIALLSAANAFATYDPLASSFTLPVIPDPQYYTTAQWKTDQYYNTQMTWIVANQASKNIPFVFGMGDNVQDGNPYTTNADLSIGTTLSGNINPPESQGYPAQDTAGHPSITVIDPVNQSDYELEWKRASASWATLDAANIPYYTVIGNHDYFHWDQKKEPSEFEKYFGPSRYVGKPNFGGFSPANTSSTTAVKAYAGLDTYSFFNAGGYKFLNIALQFTPDAGDFAWAQSIINANPGIPTIVDTHDYQNTTGRDGAGNNIWTGLINSNPQIFMVLSGHVNGSHQQTSVDAAGKQVFEILTDYQDDHFTTSNGFNKNYANGGGFLRYLTFDTVADTINATSYSPYIASQGGNAILTNYSGTGGNADAFTLNFDFNGRFGPPPLVNGFNFYWDPTHTHSGTGSGGSGTWDASGSSNWYRSGTSNTLWSGAAAADTAAFGGTTGGTITISGNVTASHVTFMSPGYTATGGTLILNGAAVIDTTSAASATINSVIGGSAGLFAKGARLALRATNTFTGTVSVTTGGTLDVTADSNLGASTNAITLDGGTFSYTGGAAPLTMTTRVFTIGASGGTFDTPNTVSGSNDKIVINKTNGLTGAGNITKTGAGTLTVYGNGNNATGDWTISGGVVEVGPATGLGSGSVTVNSGGELADNTTGAMSNAIIVNTGATIGSDNTTTVTSNLTGPITASGNFNVRLGNFWSSLSQNLMLGGKISGSGAFAITPAAGTTTTTGKLTLTGDNSLFSGGVAIPTGTLSVGATAGRPLGAGAVTLSGGKLALTGQTIQTGAATAAAAIGVTGYNKDTIYGNPDDPSTTTTVGLDNVYSFFEDGFSPDELAKNGGQSLTPGITLQNFNSAVTNSVTHTNTPFSIASFTNNNTLQIAHASAGTMTLNVSGAYTSLAVLATATFGADDTPTVKLNFADGTSATATYKAFDWSIGTDAARTAASAFGTTGVARYSPVQGLDARAFGLYESDIDLTNIGGVDYSNKQLVSMTFSAANGDGQTHALTDIFAVSGTARGWVASTFQNYSNAVNVTANSSIDVSGVLSATMGALTINASKLSVTSSDATTASYNLALGATTLNGAASFDIASSSGGGAGTLLLGAVSGSGSITKSGAGTLKFTGGGAISSGLMISAGMVEVDANTNASTLAGNGAGILNIVGASLKLTSHADAAASISALSITNGALDLNDNDLAIHYATSPAGTIRSYLTSGFNGGNWNGPGLASLAAHNDANFLTGLGYADNATLGLTSFDGAGVDAHTLIVKYTYYGDSNLDGKVDASDFRMFLDGFAATSASSWAQGDYTYDGRVDLGNDFNLFLINYLRGGNSLGDLAPIVQSDAALSITQKAQLLSLVPEPGSITLLGAAGLLALRRRRR
jgi:hypothetical protein